MDRARKVSDGLADGSRWRNQQRRFRSGANTANYPGMDLRSLVFDASRVFPAVSPRPTINVFTSVNTAAAFRKHGDYAGNTEPEVAENKRVDTRKLPVAQQFPVGDDVSAYTRCEAARVYAVGHHSVFFQMDNRRIRQRGDRRPKKRAGAGP